MSIFVETDPDGFILFDEPEEASGLSDRFAREFRKRGFVDRFAKSFKESEHPRDSGGQFTSGGGDVVGGLPLSGQESLVKRVSQTTRNSLSEALEDPKVSEIARRGGLSEIRVESLRGKKKPKNGWSAGHVGLTDTAGGDSALLIHPKSAEFVEKSSVEVRRRHGLKRVICHEAGHGLWSRVGGEELKKKFADAVQKDKDILGYVSRTVNVKAPAGAWDESSRLVTEAFAEIVALEQYDPERYGQLSGDIRQVVSEMQERADRLSERFPLGWKFGEDTKKTYDTSTPEGRRDLVREHLADYSSKEGDKGGWVPLGDLYNSYSEEYADSFDLLTSRSGGSTLWIGDMVESLRELKKKNSVEIKGGNRPGSMKVRPAKTESPFILEMEEIEKNKPQPLAGQKSLFSKLAAEFNRRGFVDRYQQQKLIDWEEEKHPRDDDGKFTSGSGTPEKTKEEKPREEKKTEQETAQEAPTTVQEPDRSWDAPKVPTKRSLEINNHWALEGAQASEAVFQEDRLKRFVNTDDMDLSRESQKFREILFDWDYRLKHDRGAFIQEFWGDAVDDDLPEKGIRLNNLGKYPAATLRETWDRRGGPDIYDAILHMKKATEFNPFIGVTSGTTQISPKWGKALAEGHDESFNKLREAYPYFFPSDSGPIKEAGPVYDEEAIKLLWSGDLWELVEGVSSDREYLDRIFVDQKRSLEPEYHPVFKVDKKHGSAPDYLVPIGLRNNDDGAITRKAMLNGDKTLKAGSAQRAWAKKKIQHDLSEAIKSMPEEDRDDFDNMANVLWGTPVRFAPKGASESQLEQQMKGKDLLQENVGMLIDNWAGTSGDADPTALFLQMAAQEELGSGDYGGLKDMEVPDEIAVPWDDFGEITGIDEGKIIHGLAIDYAKAAEGLNMLNHTYRVFDIASEWSTPQEASDFKNDLREELVTAGVFPEQIAGASSAIISGFDRKKLPAQGTAMSEEEKEEAKDIYRALHDILGPTYDNIDDIDVLDDFEERVVALRSVARQVRDNPKLAREIETNKKKRSRGLAQNEALLKARTRYKSAGAGGRVFIRAMYDNTQKMFSRMGYSKDDTVTLYRGIKFRADQMPKELADLPINAPFSTPSTITGYDQQPLSSFSTSADIAAVFSAPYKPNQSDNYAGEIGFQTAEEVPISRIVATHQSGFGCLTEREMVVMPSKSTPAIKVWKQEAGSRPMREEDAVPGYNQMTENGKWVRKPGTNDIELQVEGVD